MNYDRTIFRVAEVARAAVAVSGAFALFVAVAEIYRPGVVGAVLPPEDLLGMCALVAVVGVLADPPAVRRSLAWTTVLALSVAAIAGSAVWTYFAPIPDLRPWLTAAAALITGTLIVTARAEN